MKMYRVRLIANGKVSTMTEEEWQTVRGKWPNRYTVEEVTVNEAKGRAFKPPPELIMISAKVELKEENTEPTKRKPGRPRKTENAEQ